LKSKAARLRLLEAFRRRGLGARPRFQNLRVEISHAFFLSANVQSAIAANGEKPFHRLTIEADRFVPLEPHEGLLHDVARPFAVADNARRVLQKRQLEALQQSVDSCAGFHRSVRARGRHFKSINARAHKKLRIFLPAA
jgi:hypothetical protein